MSLAVGRLVGRRHRPGGGVRIGVTGGEWQSPDAFPQSEPISPTVNEHLNRVINVKFRKKVLSHNKYFGVCLVANLTKEYFHI